MDNLLDLYTDYLLATEELTTPIAVEFVRKSETVVDEQGQLRRQSPVTKNELNREFVKAVKSNRIAALSEADKKTGCWHSIKQCSSLGRSPNNTPETQQAHCIAAIISYVKLEKLNLKNRMNHFALKSQIWVEATRHSLQSMSKISTTPDKYAFLSS